MKKKFRCSCPITSALDILGDKWTLVIIKQMLLQGVQTFKAFLESDEAIATNILAARLKMLENYNILIKTKLSDNKKTNIYKLTESGLELTPIIVELVLWSDNNIKAHNPDVEFDNRMALIKTNKAQFIEQVKTRYRLGDF